MKSICLFSSFFNQNKIPYYVKYYLEELRNYFTDVVLLTNEKKLEQPDIQYLQDLNIDLKMYDNEGYDFGMYYKAIKEYDLKSYERVGLINDSCILFKSLAHVFNRIDSSDWDYCGLVSSKRISFHIQSYFIVINRNAIAPLRDYFLNNGIITDYKKVIQTYEVGLSKHIQSLQLKAGALYSSKDNIEQHNPSFFVIEELIKEGMPMIKKKIIFRSYRRGEYLTLLRMKFNVDERYYINLIKKNNSVHDGIDFKKVLKDFPKKNMMDIYLYKLILFFYNVASKSKLLTYLFHKFILIRRRWRGDSNKQIIISSEPEIE
jgi:lipopolysaccharide biosynthesis protein